MPSQVCFKSSHVFVCLDCRGETVQSHSPPHPPAPKPVHVMPAIPEPTLVMSANPKPAHTMPVMPESAHLMSAQPQPAHVMPAKIKSAN